MRKHYQLKENATQLQARQLYVEQGIKIEAIGKVVGKSAKTVHRWVWRFGWREARAKWIRIPMDSADQIRSRIDFLLKEMRKAGSGVEVSKIGDAIAKLHKVLETLERDQNRLGSILWATNDIDKFLKRKRAEGAYDQVFMDQLDRFLTDYSNYVVETYGR